MKSSSIPVNVFAGELGSGKTTIIINLIKQLDLKNYKVVLLKNEYGDENIDNILANEYSISLFEMINGCLCCTLLGKLQDGLVEIISKNNPDRIIIESAGSAFPLPIILEVNKFKDFQYNYNKKELTTSLYIDSVVYVIDAKNFDGIDDTSSYAKRQMECVDLIVINKMQLVEDDEKLEYKLDDIFNIVPNVPNIKSEDGNISKDILLGLDAKEKDYSKLSSDIHNFKVETFAYKSNGTIDKEKLLIFLNSLPKKMFLRIKGVIKTINGDFVLNYVGGRTTFHKIHQYKGGTKIVFMAKKIEHIKQDVLKKLNEMEVL